MTTAQLEYPTRSHEMRGRYRGESPAMRASRSRRTGMVSEAVVARYIGHLSRTAAVSMAWPSARRS